MLVLCVCHKAQAHLSVNRLGYFHLHTCPGALTRCDNSGARSEGRVSYLVDTGVSYVHEFLLINVLVFTTAALAGQRTNTSGVVEGSNVLITVAKPSS